MLVLENQRAVYSSYMSTGARRQKALLFDPPANEPYQTQALKGEVIGLGGIAENLHLQQVIVDFGKRSITVQAAPNTSHQNTPFHSRLPLLQPVHIPDYFAAAMHQDIPPYSSRRWRY